MIRAAGRRSRGRTQRLCHKVLPRQTSRQPSFRPGRSRNWRRSRARFLPAASGRRPDGKRDRKTVHCKPDPDKKAGKKIHGMLLRTGTGTPIKAQDGFMRECRPVFVSSFRAVLHGHPAERERRRVHAVAFARRQGPVVKDVAEVRPAGAEHFGAFHAVRESGPVRILRGRRGR